MQRYREMKRQLMDFVDQQPKTNIRILFFQPKGENLVKEIKDSFHAWNVNGEPLYITYENDACCYVYRQPTIKYLVTQHGIIITDRVTAEIDSVIDTETKKQIDDHGDHLTITLLLTRYEGMFLKTHKTIYTEKMDPPFEFDRTEEYCNIHIDPDNIQIAPNSQCYDKDKPTDPSDILQKSIQC